MNSEKSLICVVGATGNQGGSVARRFQAAGFRVRGLTRNPSSLAAQELASSGVEMIHANLDDVESLVIAFKDANVIFSVTNYWEPFFRPDCRRKAQELGISYRKFAYNVEYQQGRNIADAAATAVNTLSSNGFLVSTLSHANKCSHGIYTELYHFDAKADVFPFYVRETYPQLAAKMSCIQTGYFYTSFRILPTCYFGKLSDGSVQTSFTTDPEKPVPHLDPVGDMGNFTYAVYQMPPGNEYMAEGTTCSWTEWIKTLGGIAGTSVSYKQVTMEEMIGLCGSDQDMGIEIADMFSYSSNPGYDGGCSLLKAEDIEARYQLSHDKLEDMGQPPELVSDPERKLIRAVNCLIRTLYLNTCEPTLPALDVATGRDRFIQHVKTNERLGEVLAQKTVQPSFSLERAMSPIGLTVQPIGPQIGSRRI